MSVRITNYDGTQTHVVLESGDAYSKTEADNLLNAKASKTHTHDDRYYTESETNNLLSNKANSNHGHNNFGGANSYYSGSSGMVPAPNAGDQGKFLKGDGTWGYIPDNTMTVDTVLDSYSNNPIANKTVTAALNGKASSNHNHDTSYASKSHTHSGYASSSHSHNNATQNSDGFLSYTDKRKLDSISYGAGGVTVDSSLSATSTNAIQNKVVTNALNNKSDVGHTHNYAASSHHHPQYADKTALGDQVTFSLSGTTLTITTK